MHERCGADPDPRKRGRDLALRRGRRLLRLRVGVPRRPRRRSGRRVRRRLGGGPGGGPGGSGGGSGGGPGGGSGGGSGGTSDGSYSSGDSEATTTDDGTYLRGAQVADRNGVVQFTTIYPGWYRGRTVHIHLKLHIDRKTAVTTQLYFDETVNDAVFATSPYDDHTGRETRNEDDSIYDPSGLVTVRKTASGYLGGINIGVSASAA
jgi:hypothetical protein